MDPTSGGTAAKSGGAKSGGGGGSKKCSRGGSERVNANSRTELVLVSFLRWLGNIDAVPSRFRSASL